MTTMTMQHCAKNNPSAQQNTTKCLKMHKTGLQMFSEIIFEMKMWKSVSSTLGWLCSRFLWVPKAHPSYLWLYLRVVAGSGIGMRKSVKSDTEQEAEQGPISCQLWNATCMKLTPDAMHCHVKVKCVECQMSIISDWNVTCKTNHQGNCQTRLKWRNRWHFDNVQDTFRIPNVQTHVYFGFIHLPRLLLKVTPEHFQNKATHLPCCSPRWTSSIS